MSFDCFHGRKLELEWNFVSVHGLQGYAIGDIETSQGSDLAHTNTKTPSKDRVNNDGWLIRISRDDKKKGLIKKKRFNCLCVKWCNIHARATSARSSQVRSVDWNIPGGLPFNVAWYIASYPLCRNNETWKRRKLCVYPLQRCIETQIYVQLGLRENQETWKMWRWIQQKPPNMHESIDQP